MTSFLVHVFIFFELAELLAIKIGMEPDSFLLGFSVGLSEFHFLSKDDEIEVSQSDFYDELLDQLKKAESDDGYSPLFYPEIDAATPLKHKSKSKCPECQVEFVSHKGMMQHKAKIHDKLVKTVPCTQCGKCFKHKYALEFHVKQVHEKSTRVQCEMCFKVLYNKYAYRTHVKAQHESF
mmetsp:Transcript_32731/g.56961  ORF Transcript_32731/g.56961 Transcript_32731/m.56961 type:complete len:179 (+) Transcript_32731:4871-5407(+)